MQILITGGSGFIGSNLAARGIKLGYKVTIVDNLSRPGVGRNLDWLRSLGEFEFFKGDIRNCNDLTELFALQRYDAVFHEAAQVAVTSSVRDPRTDFEINALGTFNLLEAIRKSRQNPLIIFASTNKVYGSLADFEVVETDKRYIFSNHHQGVSESTSLEFYSPYGCSKGVSDQYMIDYRRIFGLRTITFRQSCIYGPRQLGLEDQGWVSWFAISSVLGRPITIYGNGKQVRDLLYIDDLVDLYFRAIEIEPTLKAYTFNVGGGSENSLSLLEVISLLEQKLGRRIEVNYSEPRPGDQPVYVSDIRAVCDAFQWRPRFSPSRGISLLLSWITENHNLFSP